MAGVAIALFHMNDPPRRRVGLRWSGYDILPCFALLAFIRSTTLAAVPIKNNAGQTRIVTMPVAQAELAEYLAEIRASVCSRCVERPPGGPPCKPLGNDCGVEMHLAELIDSIPGSKQSVAALP
jgi:hypothetical protein